MVFEVKIKIEKNDVTLIVFCPNNNFTVQFLYCLYKPNIEVRRAYHRQNNILTWAPWYKPLWVTLSTFLISHKLTKLPRYPFFLKHTLKIPKIPFPLQTSSLNTFVWEYNKMIQIKRSRALHEPDQESSETHTLNFELTQRLLLNNSSANRKPGLNHVTFYQPMRNEDWQHDHRDAECRVSNNTIINISINMLINIH